MKKYLRDCFRYKISGISLFICLTFSMLAAYYGITIYKNLYYEKNEKEEYQYNSQNYFTFVKDEDESFPSVPDECAANLKLINYSVYEDDTQQTVVSDVVLHTYKEKYPLVSGYYPEEISGKMCVLGRERAKSAYEKNGNKYYKIFGEEYLVTGVIGSPDSMVFDAKLLLYNNNPDSVLWEHIYSDSAFGYIMVLESDDEDTEALYRDYLKGYTTSPSEEVESINYASANPVSNEKLYCIIIFVFCFLCISVVNVFWISQRTHELQVCRICGFSNRMLAGRIIKDLFMISMLSLAAAIFLVFVINKLLGNLADEYKLEFSANIIIPYMLVWFAALLVSCVLPMIRMLNANIPSALTEEL